MVAAFLFISGNKVIYSLMLALAPNTRQWQIGQNANVKYSE